MYPYTQVDSAGQMLTGANKYTLTFAKDATPPANGFWSITMYEIDQGWWLFATRSISLRLVRAKNQDQPGWFGDAIFPKRSPGAEKEANWLPAPKGDFIPMLRMLLAKREQSFYPSIAAGHLRR